MILSYFDSSILLSILLDEERQKEAYKYWQNPLRVSSILLKIETVTTLRRIFENNKRNLSSGWLTEKIKTMDEYLATVNFMAVNDRIEREIYSKKELAQCRSLDAIHIATALQFREIANNEETNLFTFDKTMLALAERYEFRTNRL